MSSETEFKLPEPGPQHELMKPFEGTFKAAVQMWMGPGEPMLSSGTIVNSFQLDGLYLHQDYKGDATDGPFPSFQGKGYWGYNSTSQQFEGFWIDSASSSMQMETGTVDETGKVFEMNSEFVMPGSDIKMKKRSVFTVVSPDSNTMESFITPPGADEMMNMRIEYTRIP